MFAPLSLRKVKPRGLPKYRQAREILQEAIRSGRFAPGSKLPSTKAISDVVNVSLITAHRALDELVELGWVRREVGRGTFVRDDIDIHKSNDREISIGLILEHDDHLNIDDFYHGTLINGLRKEARGDACRVEFFFHDKFDLQGSKRRADAGLICIHPPLERRDRVERLAQKCPVVVLGGAYDNATVACIDCDNHLGAREAIQHLLGFGHRRVMVLSGPTSMSNSRDRMEAAVAELTARGCPPDPADVLESRDTIVMDDETRDRLENRLAAVDRPTAVFAGGFYLAMAAMHAGRKAGLHVPRDLSVVGFDDPASGQFLDPPLTTIRQPLESMAARAYVTVRDVLLGATNRPTLIRLAPELITRKSTGPAPELGKNTKSVG